MSKSFLISLLLTVTFLVSACGQTGRLYLPEPKPTPVSSQQG